MVFLKDTSSMNSRYSMFKFSVSAGSLDFKFQHSSNQIKFKFQGLKSNTRQSDPVFLCIKVTFHVNYCIYTHMSIFT